MMERSSQREQLILEHLACIKYIASRFSAVLPPSVEICDLISEGIFGLLAAADRFDPSRGVKFKTYAETRIRGAILDSLRSQDWLPRSLRRRFKRLIRALNELEQRLGRAASEKEVSDEMRIGIDELRELMALSNPKSTRAARLVAETKPGNCDPETANIIDRRQNALLRIQQREMRGILADAISKLPGRERLVISLYYYDGLNMKEIGKVLGVKESRVSQYHAKAKSKLYSRLRRVLSTDPRVWSTLE